MATLVPTETLLSYRLRGRSGVPGLVLAGFVGVLVVGVLAGLVGVPEAGVVLAGLAGALDPGFAGAAPLPLVPAPVFGVAAGVAFGSDTSGVGSGGNGFERTLAIN